MACIIRQLQVAGFDHNLSYLLTAGEDAVLVDPAGELDVIRDALPEKFNPKYILLTHGHPDHAEKTEQVKGFFPAPVLGHPNCGVRGVFPLIDGQTLPIGELGDFVEVLFTPGHSRDSVCYLVNHDQGILTGDTLFVSYVGYGRADALFDSLCRLKKLPGRTIVYPGHDYGATPTSTLEEEKKSNPYFSCTTEEEFTLRLKDLD